MNKIAAYDEAFRFLLEFTDYEKVTKYKYDNASEQDRSDLSMTSRTILN